MRRFPTHAILGLIVAAAFMSMSLLEAQAGKASGTYIVNGKKITIRNVTAVTYDTPSQGRLVSVLLSDKPADPKTFTEYTRIGPGERYVPGMITGAWVTMHMEKAFEGFQFTFRPDRSLMLNDVLVGTRDDNFSILDEYLVFEATSVSPRLAGRIRTKDAIVTLNKEKVGIDLTFDTPVVQVGK